MYTDYVVAPTRVFLQGRSPVGQRPGPNPLIVKQWGGRMIIEGTQVIVEDSTLPLLPTDVPIVLFVVFDDKDQCYHVYNDSAGAMAVHGTKVKPLHKPPAGLERFVGMGYANFVGELSRELPVAAKPNQ